MGSRFGDLGFLSSPISWQSRLRYSQKVHKGLQVIVLNSEESVLKSGKGITDLNRKVSEKVVEILDLEKRVEHPVVHSSTILKIGRSKPSTAELLKLIAIDYPQLSDFSCNVIREKVPFVDILSVHCILDRINIA